MTGLTRFTGLGERLKRECARRNLDIIRVSGSAASVAHADDQFEKVVINGHVGYIVSGKVGLTDVKPWLADGFVDYAGLTSFWKPTKQEVMDAESSNQKYVQRAKNNSSLIFPGGYQTQKVRENAKHEVSLLQKNYANYSIQFVGVVVYGRKRIYCNYFDQALKAFGVNGSDPSRRFILVNDGGYHYWQIEYDLGSHSSLNFLINGPWELDR